ncbi:hypothetical protein [Ralstonia solanacearum]|uniref:hypothetical protein n=1 Tax=Ralstonia solanacearum TaxID=305 RepID=UPI001E44B1BF|nr:hypothetical protein [Ralstonia solanacearum]MCL9828321.1 hypothetical protein [Ralstonia solanacearum]MCL9833089.1 hypothetical protein [Ralstonia solanacearum]MCL9837870.1 hypothetical protein [Ralstonia solanacearum]
MRLFSHPDLRDDLQVDEGCAERLLKAASGAVSSRQAFDVHSREVKRQQWLRGPGGEMQPGALICALTVTTY